MVDAGTGAGAELADRASRLFRFLARVQGVGGQPVLDADDLGAMQWLGELPESAAVRFTPGSEDKPFLRLDKLVVPPPVAAPDAEVRAWLVPGRLDDYTVEPALRSHRVDGSARTERLADHPEVAERFGAWLRRWRMWAEQARVDEPAHRCYRAVYRMYSDVHASAESREAVLALGCVVWRRPGVGVVRRHALTLPVKFDFDTDSGTLTVRLDLDTGRPAVELLDFLDPELILDPALLRAAEKEFLRGTDPFDRDAVAVLMRRLLHSLGPDTGVFDEMMPAVATADPVGYYAPALIVRSRGTRGLARVLDTIADRIADRGSVPVGLRTLVDASYAAEPEPPTDSGAIVQDGPDSFLPLPLNAVQLSILRHVDCHTHTIVQGPPGTGKTHTAAALITHLLAQGKRVLVTAHTDRALAEVRGKLPGEIRDLCVSVAGATRDNFDDLKLSMERIAAAADAHDGGAARRRIAEVNARIAELRSARAGLMKRLLHEREHEVLVHEIGSYRGTAAELVLAHRADADRFSWIAELDPAPGTRLPVGPGDVREWRTLLLDEALSDPDVAGAQLLTVADLPTVAQVAHWQRRLSAASERAGAVAAHASRPWIEAIRRLRPATRGEISATVRRVDNVLTELSGNQDEWVRAAVSDVARGRGGVWFGRHRRSLELLAPTAGLLDELGIAQVRVSGGDRGALVALAEAVLRLIDSSGPLRVRADGAPRVGITANKALKEAAPLFERVRVDGRIPVEAAHLRAFLRQCELDRLVEQLDEVWSGTGDALPGSLAVRLAQHRADAEQLRSVLGIGAELVAAGQLLRGYGIVEPDWSDSAARRTLLASFDAAAAIDEEDSVADLFDHVAARVAGLRYQPGATIELHALHRALEQRDVEGYQRAHVRLTELAELRVRFARRTDLDIRLAQWPRLRATVAATAGSPVWDTRLTELEQAWDWAALGAWLAGLGHEPANELFDQLDDIETGLRAEATRLAVVKAWDRAVAPERLGPGTRTDLRQYAQLVRRLGKGTGMHADRRRREIRETMGRCRSAVPVWIMPIYRVVEQLDIEPDMFDVVVVDEASQAGAEAVFLQYLAPRIVVIGDERQVSPSGVGVKIDTVRGLAEQYLAGDPRKASWLDSKRSLFDDASMRFASRLTLIEHRRCVPEIIGFSNKIAYAKDAKPLIPVRVYGSDRLPPIRTEYVVGGVSTKSNLNEAEADRIVARVRACLSDPRYASKTFGVVSLLGTAQAELIWNKLLAVIPPEEIDRRRLRCGDAADFQGAERDVMFLSMVKSAEPGTRLMPQTGEAAIQRYNVAVSRAADQLWLFHSLRLDELTNPDDMRYQLLDYCLSHDTEPAYAQRLLPAPVREDRRVAPFTTVFAQQVFNRILARNYQVVAGYEVGAHLLDMVVIGGHIRVAVLCESDDWTGPAAYQQELGWQRDLQRCGWPFFRIRRSQFVFDPDDALAPLWELLGSVGLTPVSELPEPVVAPEPIPPEPPVLLREAVFAVIPEAEVLAGFRWDKPWVDETSGDTAVLDTRTDTSEPDTPDVDGERVIPEPSRCEVDAVPVLPVGDTTPEPSRLRVGVRERLASTRTGEPAEYRSFSDLLAVSQAGYNIASAKEDVLRIVAVEGPVTAARLHAVVARVRSADDEVADRAPVLVDRALEIAVRQGFLVADDFLELGQSRWFSYRTPEQPAYLPRLLGVRAIDQVPVRELAEVLFRTAESTGWNDRVALMTRAVATLGQGQLTDRAIAALAIVLPIAERRAGYR
ncbi:AAA domain-containing protein [Nocardia thailandica]